MILIDSVFRAGENYHPEVFFEKCKYAIKEKKIPKYIIGDIEICSDSHEENSDEKTLLEKIKSSDYEENSEKEIPKKLRAEKKF